MYTTTKDTFYCNNRLRFLFCIIDPVKILSIQNAGASGPFMSVAKKLVIKQGEPVQLVCNVVGYPTPSVQWTRRVSVRIICLSLHFFPLHICHITIRLLYMCVCAGQTPSATRCNCTVVGTRTNSSRRAAIVDAYVRSGLEHQ